MGLISLPSLLVWGSIRVKWLIGFVQKGMKSGLLLLRHITRRGEYRLDILRGSIGGTCIPWLLTELAHFQNMHRSLFIVAHYGFLSGRLA
jgi:hypothetical protein